MSESALVLIFFSFSTIKRKHRTDSDCVEKEGKVTLSWLRLGQIKIAETARLIIQKVQCWTSSLSITGRGRLKET